MKDSIISVFSEHVKTSPDKLLFRRINVREEKHEVSSYAELYTQVHKFAAGLEGISAPGDRIILTFPSSIAFIVAFLGCLTARRIPVPHAVLRNNNSAERLSRIIADCSAVLSIAPISISEKLGSLMQNEKGHRVVSFEEVIDSKRGESVLYHHIDFDDIAFLQYTSGSTGNPKGVIVTHANLSANIEQIKRALPPIEHLVSWLPQFHDMGLVGATLAPIYLGKTCSFFSPPEFIQRPLRWLKALSELRADMSVAPNFGYAYLLQRCKPHTISGLDLSHVRVLMSGAEPVKGNILRCFQEALGGTGLREDIYFPTYGLAEATLFVTGGPGSRRFPTAHLASDGHRCLPDISVDKGVEVVSCGLPGVGIDVSILKPQSESSVETGEVGEVCIRGENITPGYWGCKQDLTVKPLRTGDLGFIKDGELYITGRLKDLIILRGRNIYPQDIESLSQNLVPNANENSCATVLCGETLILVQELPTAIRDKNKQAVLASNINTKVTETFDIRVDRIIFTKSNTIPRTTSGKISRSALVQKLCRSEFPAIYDTADKTLEQI